MSIPGIDWPGLAGWMATAVPSVGRPLSAALIAGGRSNLTYVVETAEGRLVLRRPPLGHVLPTAHDMRREWTVISALAATDVPVPGPVAFCADEDVIGAPFYLMRHVDGVAVRGPAQADGTTPPQVRRLSERLAEVLAAIHAIDHRAAGLAGFGRPEGYLARQLDRWNQQWERSNTRDVPEYHGLAARLRERLPARSATALLHGDFRLDNTLVTFGAEPEIAAVVDWEMSTLGDPLADLGLTLGYWHDPGDPDSAVASITGTATRLPGFLGPREFAEHYARVSGADIDDLAFYTALGAFKLAVIAEGIHARFRQGKTVGEGFEAIGDAVPALLARAHRGLDADTWKGRG
ncbi:phosphotransferase family protein [Spongiactinospora sp. TRM90649]|uniref:phosphotransferase family protein n=1 Tax=Spongiactinospora sp. TRM90649 TaxID=3031114 RepID=UPI0023F98F45|nr:phosphotransferase family protein [Spongiactinospora sp. TRM90649]MDF5757251.1 phosphotransferase family protein [Spongiactinospora sp. TRM90649]